MSKGPVSSARTLSIFDRECREIRLEVENQASRGLEVVAALLRSCARRACRYQRHDPSHNWPDPTGCLN